MTPSDMLAALSRIWLSCAMYEDIDHTEVLGHVHALQSIIFGLEKEEE